MQLERGSEGSEPVRPEPIERIERQVARSEVVASGTLACPVCDAPVALLGGAVGPAARLACPFCGHAGRAREFLSLAAPSRPARVVVRLARRPVPTPG